MSGIARCALACALLSVALAGPAAADIELHGDGWHRWEVPAGRDGGGACCRHVLRGGEVRVGCNLGAGTDGPRADARCETTSETLQLFVEMKDGRARQVHAFGGACPVDTGTEADDHGPIATAESLRWLTAQLGADPRVLDGTLVAIAFHENRAAVRTLVEVSEDTGQPAAARERALFWLVQSDTDEAWAWLDRLLEP